MFKRTVFALTSSMILGAVFAGTAEAASFVVDAKVNSSTGGTGLSTGIFYSLGDTFQVSVDPDDLWSAGGLPRWSNADGLSQDLFATGTDESGQSVGTLIGKNFGNFTSGGLSLFYGTLVGEIDGNYFALGTDFVGAAPGTGELKLHYWDSNEGDNSGQITAHISNVAESVPEPASMLGLLTIGAMTAGHSLKKKAAA